MPLPFNVDPALAASFACPDGLLDLPFLLLGTNLPLAEGGAGRRVTAKAVTEYRAAVTEFVCGSKLALAATVFTPRRIF
jgi:hypothetical protein